MSSTIEVRLPDGSTKSLPAGSSGFDLASDIGPRLAKAALLVSVNGHLSDLSVPLVDGADVAVSTRACPRSVPTSSA